MAVQILPITRKKRVIDKYNPDTFRVISTEAEGLHRPLPASSATQLPLYDELQVQKPTPYVYDRETQVLPKGLPDYRANRPHPEATDFLRHNVLFLNEPVCSVHTGETQADQGSWWPSRTSDKPLEAPSYTVNTTFRQDFRKRKGVTPAATRHSSNPNKEPSKGAVPVNFLRGADGKQTLWKEGLSYEHQYNSRLDPSYPIRGKRHGAFVWDKMNPEDSQRFIDHYSSLAKQERDVANNQCAQATCSTENCSVTWPPSNGSRETTQGQTHTYIQNGTAESSSKCQNNNNVFQEAKNMPSRRQSVTLATSCGMTADLPPVDQ
ncbi:uncharacterized protein LOC135469011 [Liolophura sinensis]|uniref:uncharacterized protein LOC135469011 n=1 Tax=Liolophura sinensis TaxID=3198878 RepID=UPI003157FEF6